MTVDRAVVARAVVALGSNLGDRDAILRSAVAALDATPGIRVTAASAPVESIAVTLTGLDESKPSYLNGVALVETTLDPPALLAELNRIEAEHGRVRLERWGDRTLDLDLIVHGDSVVDTDHLTLPHPRAVERAFVLEPWLQIEPEAEIPGAGRVDALSAALGDEVAPVDGSPSLLLDAPGAPR